MDNKIVYVGPARKHGERLVTTDPARGLQEIGKAPEKRKIEMTGKGVMTTYREALLEQAESGVKIAETAERRLKQGAYLDQSKLEQDKKIAARNRQEAAELTMMTHEIQTGLQALEQGTAPTPAFWKYVDVCKDGISRQLEELQQTVRANPGMEYVHQGNIAKKAAALSALFALKKKFREAA